LLESSAMGDHAKSPSPRSPRSPDVRGASASPSPAKNSEEEVIDVAEEVKKMSHHQLYGTSFEHIKQRFPEDKWEGQFLLQLVFIAYVYGDGGLTTVPIMDDRGECARRHSSNTDRRGEVAVKRYLKKILAKGMMVAMRGTPVCIRKVEGDGRVVYEFVAGGTLLRAAILAITKHPTNKFAQALKRDGFPDCRVLRDDVPADISNWLKQEANLWHGGQDFTSAEQLLKSEEGDISWKMSANQLGIKTTTCPARGPQSYYAKQSAFISDRYPRSDYWQSHEHFQTCCKLRAGLAAHDLLEQTIDLMEDFCDFSGQMSQVETMNQLFAVYIKMFSEKYKEKWSVLLIGKAWLEAVALWMKFEERPVDGNGKPIELIRKVQARTVLLDCPMKGSVVVQKAAKADEKNKTKKPWRKPKKAKKGESVKISDTSTITEIVETQKVGCSRLPTPLNRTV
jgi:hypothetical protein